MAFKCVPLNPAWVGDTKLDIRAIYKRANGDLTSGLPLRRHHNWVAKGLEYVTLADPDSLSKAAKFLKAEGHDVNSFVMAIDGNGDPTPWDVAKYVAEHGAAKAQADADLKALIAEYGWETVEKIKGVKVPEHLRGMVPMTATAIEEPASDAPVVRRGRPRKSGQVPA